MSNVFPGGPLAGGGTYPILAQSGAVFTSDADHTASGTESQGDAIYVTCQGGVTLTAKRKLVLPLGVVRQFTIHNNTNGGQTITVGGSSGTTVDVPYGTAVRVICPDGSNYYGAIGAGSTAIAVANVSTLASTPGGASSLFRLAGYVSSADGGGGDVYLEATTPTGAGARVSNCVGSTQNAITWVAPVKQWAPSWTFTVGDFYVTSGSFSIQGTQWLFYVQSTTGGSTIGVSTGTSANAGAGPYSNLVTGNPVIGSTFTDGQLTVLVVGPVSLEGYGSRLPSPQTYAVGAQVSYSGYVYTCTSITTGVAASTDTTTKFNAAPTTYGQTLIDGGVTWTCTGSCASLPANCVAMTVTGHGCYSRQAALVRSVGGATAANGSWLVCPADANTLVLLGSYATGMGAYTSGGTLDTTVLTADGAHGFVAGQQGMAAGVGGFAAVNLGAQMIGVQDSTRISFAQDGRSASYTSGGILGDGGTTIPLANGRWLRDIHGGVDPRWFGAVGNGASNDGPALLAADTAAANGYLNGYASGSASPTSVVLGQGTYEVSQMNLVLHQVTARGSGKCAVKPGLGANVLIASRPHANPHAWLYDLSGGGTVRFVGKLGGAGTGYNGGDVYPRWFGAKADAQTNDLAAFQAAINAMQSGSALLLDSAFYEVQGLLFVFKSGTRIRGNGIQNSGFGSYLKPNGAYSFRLVFASPTTNTWVTSYPMTGGAFANALCCGSALNNPIFELRTGWPGWSNPGAFLNGASTWQVSQRFTALANGAGPVFGMDGSYRYFGAATNPFSPTVGGGEQSRGCWFYPTSSTQWTVNFSIVTSGVKQNVKSFTMTMSNSSLLAGHEYEVAFRFNGPGGYAELAVHDYTAGTTDYGSTTFTAGSTQWMAVYDMPTFGAYMTGTPFPYSPNPPVYSGNILLSSVRITASSTATSALFDTQSNFTAVTGQFPVTGGATGTNGVSAGTLWQTTGQFLCNFDNPVGPPPWAQINVGNAMAVSCYTSGSTTLNGQMPLMVAQATASFGWYDVHVTDCNISGNVVMQTAFNSSIERCTSGPVWFRGESLGTKFCDSAIQCFVAKDLWGLCISENAVVSIEGGGYIRGGGIVTITVSDSEVIGGRSIWPQPNTNTLFFVAIVSWGNPATWKNFQALGLDGEISAPALMGGVLISSASVVDIDLDQSFLGSGLKLPMVIVSDPSGGNYGEHKIRGTSKGFPGAPVVYIDPGAANALGSFPPVKIQLEAATAPGGISAQLTNESRCVAYNGCSLPYFVVSATNVADLDPGISEEIIFVPGAGGAWNLHGEKPPTNAMGNLPYGLVSRDKILRNTSGQSLTIKNQSATETNLLRRYTTATGADVVVAAYARTKYNAPGVAWCGGMLVQGGTSGGAPAPTIVNDGAAWYYCTTGGTTDASRVISSYLIVDGGAGYSSAPTITLRPSGTTADGGVGGATATCTAAGPGGSIDTVTITNAGTGFNATNVPIVALITGGGSPTRAAVIIFSTMNGGSGAGTAIAVGSTTTESGGVVWKCGGFNGPIVTESA